MNGNSRARRSVGMVAALVLAVVGIGIGIASGQASGNTYTGCLKNGTLTKVAIGTEPTSPCSGSATEIRWNEVGPQGLPGEPGADGVLASFDSVDGLPCSYGGVQGSIDLDYDHQSGGSVTLKCDIDPGQFADLIPSLTVPAIVGSSEFLVYDLVVANNGGSDAEDVTLLMTPTVENPKPEPTPVFPAPEGCTSPSNLPGGAFICELGTMSAGEVRSIGQLTYDPSVFGEDYIVTMTAQVLSPTLEADPNKQNNTQVLNTTITPGVVLPS